MILSMYFKLSLFVHFRSHALTHHDAVNVLGIFKSKSVCPQIVFKAKRRG